MGDFSNYERQGLRPGKTVPYEVTELVNEDGSHPVVHLEHMGAANKSLMQAMIAKAGSEEKGDECEMVIAHSARRLEGVYFADGGSATDADIPAFIRALPYLALLRLVRFVCDDANYCEYPIATPPQALAEK